MHELRIALECVKHSGRGMPYAAWQSKGEDRTCGLEDCASMTQLDDGGGGGNTTHLLTA